MFTIGKVFGIESHVLSPAETKKLYPLMNVDDIYGTLYSPTDGTIDPTGMCEALTRSAKRAGAKVIHIYADDLMTTLSMMTPLMGFANIKIKHE